MENLASAIVATGVLTGALMMIFGFRKAGKEEPALCPVVGTIKQDWTPTGNIDLRSTGMCESSAPQPLRLWVEEKRVTETAVGQRIADLRWRLATIEEGKQIVICWNARQAAPAVLLASSPCLVEE